MNASKYKNYEELVRGLAKTVTGNWAQPLQNLILHGCPGTGKTWLAKDVAVKIVAGKTYENLTEDERGRIGFVQFYPGYGYENFVEGISAKVSGGHLLRMR